MREDLYNSYMDMVEGAKPYEPDLDDLSDILGEDYNEEGDTLTSEIEIDMLNRKKKEKKLVKGKDGEFRIYPDKPSVIEDELVHFKRFNKKRVHKYTEKEMEEIREGCRSTIVHDYGDNDIYHMSDEERRQGDILADLRLKIGTLHRTYSKVDQYIEAMRIVVQAWEIFEKTDCIYSEDEFFKMVAEGRIVSNCIVMPKLRKADRYNMDLIIKYISNPELDPKDLVAKTIESPDPFYDQFDDDRDREDLPLERKLYWYYYDMYMYDREQEFHKEYGDDEEWYPSFDDKSAACDYAATEVKKDKMARIMSTNELELIVSDEDRPVSQMKDIERKYIDGYDERDIGKKLKKMSKNDRFIAKNLHEMLKSIEANPKMRKDDDEGSRSYLITDSLFDEREDDDGDIFDNMRYGGSWANDETVSLYDFAMREEILKQPVNGNTYVTYGDKELAQFFKILESNHVNTVELRRKMNCTIDQMSRAETKRTAKENKKSEAKILARIMRANNDPAFKKLVMKAEEKLNQYNEGKYEE